LELLDQIIDWIVGLPLWAAWVGIIVATFVSEDLTCIAAGLIAAGGQLSAETAIGAAGLGIFLGDLGLYAAGHWIGRPALRRAPIAWFVHDEDVELSEQWFAHRGPIVILLGRFVPGSRLPTYFAAGMLNIGIWRFASFAAIAVAIWAPLLGGGAMLLGRNVLPLVEAYELYVLPVLVGAVLLMVLVIKFVIPSFTWKGRRMVVSRWKRMTRWEFWPAWVFYTPVFLYYLWLSLRHRSLSLFTAVNPAIPAGGFVGESKSQILEGLADADGLVARTHLIRAELEPPARVRAARTFMETAQLDYPVVLKPDAGQRGSGVAVVRSEDELETYLREIRVDAVVQEYCRGLEFGVFYYRLPGEDRGNVLAITRKEFPEVVGDGVSTLERLILTDPRAVAMAKLYLEKQVRHLWDVPAAGERVRLVEIGNHCRGAVFLDGTDLRTEHMVEVFDGITRSFEGFYFGRYDLMVPSVEDFRAGRNLKIIELNGGTSEATSIYDARNSLFDAYGVLFEQWRILFEIARRNVAAGARPTGTAELLKMLGRYRRGARSHPD
jgi:membrane protein DedA with SNARE-associated domain